jgi:hypothetical protein
MIGFLAAIWVLQDAIRHPEKDILWVIRRIQFLHERAKRRGESLYEWRPA